MRIRQPENVSEERGRRIEVRRTRAEEADALHLHTVFILVARLLQAQVRRGVWTARRSVVASEPFADDVHVSLALFKVRRVR
jgi:hypothetical protein